MSWQEHNEIQGEVQSAAPGEEHPNATNSRCRGALGWKTAKKKPGGPGGHQAQDEPSFCK